MALCNHKIFSTQHIKPDPIQPLIGGVVLILKPTDQSESRDLALIPVIPTEIQRAFTLSNCPSKQSDVKLAKWSNPTSDDNFLYHFFFQNYLMLKYLNILFFKNLHFKRF